MESFVNIAKKFSNYHFIIRIDKYDVDKHSRPRAFITHAGYNGIMEAAHDGVPLITILFVRLDQITIRSKPRNYVKKLKLLLINYNRPLRKHRNVHITNGRAVELNNWGILLNKMYFKNAPEKVKETLRTIVTTNRYKIVAERISALI
uniref:glucuronosyltransferase n=1 Tax=Heterorhabditis bacteriophora TaxID=37862 RepID=A0A1I7XEE6_HETBA